MRFRLRLLLHAVLPAMLDERTRRELRARVAAAQDKVSRATSRTARAQVSLDQANNEVRRSEQLVQQGFIAPIKVEADRLATLGAEREVEGAAAERRMAAHELEQTQAALGAVQPSGAGAGASKDASHSASGFTLRAPSAGRVLRVLQASEGAVALGTPLIEVGDTQRMEVVTELLTTDALAARVGSRVVIERWGGPAVLEGRGGWRRLRPRWRAHTLCGVRCRRRSRPPDGCGAGRPQRQCRLGSQRHQHRPAGHRLPPCHRARRPAGSCAQTMKPGAQHSICSMQERPPALLLRPRLHHQPGRHPDRHGCHTTCPQS